MNTVINGFESHRSPYPASRRGFYLLDKMTFLCYTSTMDKINQPEDKCVFPGFSTLNYDFTVTMYFNNELGTFAALATKKDGDEDASFEWGTVQSEYPTIWPLVWLVCKYVDSYKWFTEDMFECLKESSPEEVPFIPSNYSPILDTLAKRINDHRVSIDDEARKKFYEAKNIDEKAADTGNEE